MKNILLAFLISLIFSSYAQENNFEIFPSGLNFTPLKANNREAKIGLIFIPENHNMKIDLGNNIDLLSLKISDFERLTMGIEFFAYALSRSYQGKRLQIDAVDGMFGGNISYSKKINNNILSGRFGVTHNSAHLVDGHWDFHNNKWIDDYKPIPYSKDFMELIFAYDYNLDFGFIKPYSGFEYAFLTRPSDIKRFNLNGGIEIGFTELLNPLFNKNLVAFLAYDFSLNGTKAYSGNNNSMLGIKFGKWNEKGLLIFISYFAGNDFFHAYYARKVKRFGFGFSVDFL